MSLSPELESKIEQARALLRRIAAEHAPAAFAHSFGAEDMVLMDLLSREPEALAGIEAFTLDTGRLPEETYALMQEVRTRYPQVPVRPYFPEATAVEAFVAEHGPNAFYESVALRKRCCAIRKVEPLQRALAGKQAWITGLRREQAPTRKDLAVQEWDADHGMPKFNPLVDWTQGEVWAYIRHFQVPYNALHDRHYPSIGCAPCTRAVTVGEDIRAGRWWWENPETKECGLHEHRRRVGGM